MVPPRNHGFHGLHGFSMPLSKANAWPRHVKGVARHPRYALLDAESSPQTHDLIGALMEVHTQLGPGFLEKAYQEALCIELESRGIPFQREAPIPIRYKGQTLETVYRADFVCHGAIILELKALAHLGPVEEAQLIHYLRASSLKVGILAAFGARSLAWRRFVC
jgi:GxxExxY protein